MPTCEQCEWWKNAERPHETFIWFLWEWDVDRLARLPPIMEGKVETSRLAEVVDYPREPNKIDLFKVHVDEDHLGHVPLDRPILLGVVRVGDKTTTICFDGHHRIARAIRDGVEQIPFRLYSEEQMIQCAIHKPQNRLTKRKAKR